MSLSEYILFRFFNTNNHIIFPSIDVHEVHYDHMYRLRHWNKMLVYTNEGFYALAGFATVVSAIDGSLVPIIAPANASVHPPVESVDRVGPNH